MSGDQKVCGKVQKFDFKMYKAQNFPILQIWLYCIYFTNFLAIRVFMAVNRRQPVQFLRHSNAILYKNDIPLRCLLLL